MGCSFDENPPVPGDLKSQKGWCRIEPHQIHGPPCGPAQGDLEVGAAVSTVFEKDPDVEVAPRLVLVARRRAEEHRQAHARCSFEHLRQQLLCGHPAES